MPTRFVPLDSDQLVHRVAEKYRSMLIKRGHGNVRAACENALDKTHHLDCRPMLDEIRRKLIAASDMSDREGTTALKAIIQGFVPETCADLKNKIHMFEQKITQIDQQIQKPVPTLEELISEIKSIRTNFPSLLMSGNRLKITTDAIVLEYDGVTVDFGKFEFIVFLNRDVDEDDDETGFDDVIKVRALSPNKNPEDSTVIHPHIQDNLICYGDGYPLIAQAFQQGRLEDVFRLLTTILNTYNPNSPHKSLGTWKGRECRCGFHPATEFYECDSCGHEMCEECKISCQDCGHQCCDSCNFACESCEEIVCGDCTSRCEGCDCFFCKECVEKCDCGVMNCDECRDSCTACGTNICNSCMVGCGGCDEDFCEKCMITCENCQKEFCKKCYDEDECSLLKQTTEKSKT